MIDAHGRHARESGHPSCSDASGKMDARFRGRDGSEMCGIDQSIPSFEVFEIPSNVILLVLSNYQSSIFQGIAEGLHRLSCGRPLYTYLT
jgi:hypothetical protein